MFLKGLIHFLKLIVCLCLTFFKKKERKFVVFFIKDTLRFFSKSDEYLLHDLKNVILSNTKKVAVFEKNYL